MKILLQQPIIHRKRNSSLNFTNVEQLSTNAHDKQILTCACSCMLISHYMYKKRFSDPLRLLFSRFCLTWRRGIITGDLQKKFQNNASTLWHQVKLSIGCHLHVIVIYKATESDKHNIKSKKKITDWNTYKHIYIPITLQLKKWSFQLHV